MHEILPAVEKALSDLWGDPVRLAISGMIENRNHVARLDVLDARPERPKRVLLKRWRSEGDAGFDPETFVSHFVNEWASLEFVTHISGPEPLAPQFYTGDKAAGFLVIEDLGAGDTLDKVLRGNDTAQAEQAFRRYGQTLGRLHAQTLGRSDDFLALRHKLGQTPRREPDGRLNFLQSALQTLEKLDFKVPSTAYTDGQQAARLLAQLDHFFAFNHGDPIPSNAWLDKSGSFYLFDFESANFDHALLEAVAPRMAFPTCGMAFVNRVPEGIWRQVEAAYRAVLVKDCPAAADETIYGPTMAAACALWALAFCMGWLERAIAGGFPAFQLNRLRQCALIRFESFVLAAREFNSFPALAETFTALIADLRSRWPPEAHELPLYPVFKKD